MTRALALAVLFAATASAQSKLKVIVDQDARGPCTTDIQSILMFVQSPRAEVLGITIVSGDLWLEQELRHTLRALEIAGRTDIPVYRGAVFPLVHTQEEARRWESLYGKQPYQGAWDGEAGPYETVPLREGEPTTRPAPGHAANFIVEAVNRYPGEVTIWSGGPLTNIALAIALDPELPRKAKELAVMGGGLAHRYRREFNWWFDPEAARIVLRAPWKRLSVTPADVSARTRHSEEIVARIARAGTPLARYIEEFHAVPADGSPSIPERFCTRSRMPSPSRSASPHAPSGRSSGGASEPRVGLEIGLNPKEKQESYGESILDQLLSIGSRSGQAGRVRQARRSGHAKLRWSFSCSR